MRHAATRGQDGILCEKVYLGESRTLALALALLPLLPATPPWHPGWPQSNGHGKGSPLKWPQPFFECGGDTGTASQASVWLSAGGTTAPPHRDRWFNVSVTLEGEKVFYLAAPKYHAEVLDSPRPSSRLVRDGPGVFRSVETLDELGRPVYVSGHSPLDFDALYKRGASFNTDDDGAIRGSHVVVDIVTLAPGDVLYLPPDWYHQVLLLVSFTTLCYESRHPTYPSIITHTHTHTHTHTQHAHGC